MKSATLSWLPEATNFSTSLARLKAELGTLADWVAQANQNLEIEFPCIKPKIKVRIKLPLEMPKII
ncbi:MAG: hypothetical protein B7Z78_05095 [Rhodospirillales bacterium 20-60-12]|nr:MAG: hypothetical protein B7Z78_05095 [Rhodospirillales bacterium 20-60-12]